MNRNFQQSAETWDTHYQSPNDITGYEVLRRQQITIERLSALLKNDYALVVDLGDDVADSSDGVFYFSGAASLAYNTPYYVKATVNKGGDSYSMQAGLVRI